MDNKQLEAQLKKFRKSNYKIYESGTVDKGYRKFKSIGYFLILVLIWLSTIRLDYSKMTTLHLVIILAAYFFGSLLLEFLRSVTWSKLAKVPLNSMYYKLAADGDLFRCRCSLPITSEDYKIGCWAPDLVIVGGCLVLGFTGNSTVIFLTGILISINAMRDIYILMIMKNIKKGLILAQPDAIGWFQLIKK